MKIDMQMKETTKTLTIPSTAYDTTKIENVEVYKNGGLVNGYYEVKAGALSRGSTVINFASTGYSLLAKAMVTITTTSTDDDSTVFSATMTNSKIYFRASAANVFKLNVSFMGLASI